MAYQMAPTLVTLSDLGGHFSCLNFFKLQMSANVAYISSDIFTEEFKPYTYPPDSRVTIRYAYDKLIFVRQKLTGSQSQGTKNKNTTRTNVITVQPNIAGAVCEIPYLDSLYHAAKFG